SVLDLAPLAMPGHSPPPARGRGTARARACRRSAPGGTMRRGRDRPAATPAHRRARPARRPPARPLRPAAGPVVSCALEVGLEARDLPSVGVACDLQVDDAEVVAVEQDHPCAGAEERPRELPDRILEPVEP